jgi:hypothetical protein
MSFPLVRYPEKIVAIHSHCDVLLRYAHSPRLRRHFYNKQFRVETVQIKPFNIMMPKDWGSVINSAMERQEFEITDCGLALMQTDFRKLEGLSNPVRAPVHCECALIDHFQRISESQTPPLTITVAPSSTPEDLITNGISRVHCLHPSHRL